jgi:hypothetical protein
VKSVEAFFEAVVMYLAIGLVVASVHALAFRPLAGEPVRVRSLAILTDVVGWPKYLVVAGREVSATIADGVALD